MEMPDSLILRWFQVMRAEDFRPIAKCVVLLCDPEGSAGPRTPVNVTALS